MKNVKSKHKTKKNPETRKQKKSLKDDFNLYGGVLFTFNVIISKY